MPKLTDIIKYSECPDCLLAAGITKWHSPPGLDPLLREFHCALCQAVFYKIVVKRDKAETSPAFIPTTK